MLTNSRISEFFTNLIDRLNEQAWFQELKGKWDELDPQSKGYLKIAGVALTLLLVIGGAGSFIWSVHSLKKELTEKSELLSLIQNSNDELRRLRDTTSNLGAGGGASEPWQPYIDSIAGSAGVPKETVSISEEKKGAGSEQVKETLFDVNLKHVNIKQVVRFAFTLDTGTRPVKTRNLLIDTHGDAAGYMDATFSVSAFTLVNK